MIAFISDIHANLEALTAVIEDIERHSVSRIICLGDIVGYGAEPEPCTDIVMERSSLTILGNHDFALINGPLAFNPMAAEIILKTREIMEPHSPSGPRPDQGFHDAFCPQDASEAWPHCLTRVHSRDDRWRFIETLPPSGSDEGRLYIHGSPLEPTFEYVFPDRIRQGWFPGRIEEMFSGITDLAFCGHSHIPCAIDSTLRCYYPDECNYQLHLQPGERYIINAGSVGQPRDRDPRSCYLLLDPDNRTITWRRINYDIAKAMSKIQKMCGRDNWCATRLAQGR
jgi:predicted phosphodiesterase